MKRFSSPQILGAMGYPSQERKNRRNNMVYSVEFQAMLDDLDDYDDPDCAEEISGQEGSDKRRRLRFDQVKALEKIFEVDNKLEPQRKSRIAKELGLQPRQVAVWFQNRRARWKTKQLERDYGLLRANYEALKVSYDKLEKDTQALTAELKELAEKLGEENGTDSLKETEINKNVSDQLCLRANHVGDPDDYEVGNEGKLIEMEGYVGFNEEISNLINPQLPLSPASSNSFVHECCSSSMRWMNCIQLLDSRAVQLPGVPPKGYPHQFVKMEEQSLSSAEEEEFSRIHFSVDQAPTLYWQH